MSVAALKRLVPVGWAGATRALVDRLADQHVFEASEADRAEIARRADALLATPALDESDARDLKFDLATADWKTRASAAARLSEDGAWTPWSVAGSLGADAADGSAAPDDARSASAILIAARETLAPGLAERHARLQGPARAAFGHERDAASYWDEAARPVVAEFARNARAHGADRRSSALRALSAAAHLKGDAMHPSSSPDPFLMGAAAASLIRETPKAREGGNASALRSLARDVASMNAVRASMWDGAAAEATRLMGAAAACAAFGRGTCAAPLALAAAPDVRAHLPTARIARVARMTAMGGAEALEDEAADPRLDADARRRLETVADALRRHPAAHAVSCAEALGMDAPPERASELRFGMRVYRAVSGDRRRHAVHEGKHGRAVRCRAIAGPDGTMVGHLAFDALSREFGGRPLYAAYALDGRRYGYAWADERPIIRRGEPEQGFMTAPERIPA